MGSEIAVENVVFTDALVHPSTESLTFADGQLLGPELMGEVVSEPFEEFRLQKAMDDAEDLKEKSALHLLLHVFDRHARAALSESGPVMIGQAVVDREEDRVILGEVGPEHGIPIIASLLKNPEKIAADIRNLLPSRVDPLETLFPGALDITPIGNCRQTETRMRLYVLIVLKALDCNERILSEFLIAVGGHIPTIGEVLSMVDLNGTDIEPYYLAPVVTVRSRRLLIWCNSKEHPD